MGNLNKKAPDESDAFLVELIAKNWHPIHDEITRWRDILTSEFNRYRLTGTLPSNNTPSRE